ncbi:uncharacterized protein EMH_0099900 [Eimeria mitis]|uniref:Uncharacterized protein n=1 Tax=Eimeria mitis TaxID=44415 RepID=U6JTR7_9EIME|nr:uncharacterized protein EMH_0099900 [Eimeria mitis]CDJ28181.1 hypothetical protein EMH_0099900 [Eimeria mitis]
MPALRRCFLWFVALLLVEQQNVYSSGASRKKAADGNAELETAGGLAGDTMAKLHAELVAQHEMMDSQLATVLLTKNRRHVIAFTVLFLILIRAIVLRRERERKRKVEEEVRPPREEPQAKEEEGKEEAEEEEEKSVPEEEPSPEQVVLQPDEPAKEVPLPQVPTQVPVPRPRRKPKAEVPPEKQPEERGADGQPEEFVQRPVTRARKTRREVVRKEMPPPEAPTQVQPGIEEQVEEEEPFQQPTQPQLVEPTPIPPTLPLPPEQPMPGPAPGVPEVAYVEPPVPPAVVMVPPYEILEPTPVPGFPEDGELETLRARRSLVSSLVDVATRLVDELPGEQARSVLDALKIKAAAAESAERDYDFSRSRRDPNLPGIRNMVIRTINSSIEGSHNDLLQLAGLAKSFGEQVYAHCSESLFFTNVERLRKPLAKCWDIAPAKASLDTLAFLGDVSITLKQENEDQLRILRSAQFIDEYEPRGFVDIYAATAALNFRMKMLERFSALDKALKGDILEFQKIWMKGMLQLDRIPLEVEANLVQELNLLLSKSRQATAGHSPSGITDADIQSIREMFAQQHADVQALETAQDYAGVSAAYERANMFNQKLNYLLEVQKNRLHTTLERQPLTKEEASAANEAMAKIAETAVEDGEECWRYLQIVNSEISGKHEETPGVSASKALLQMLTSKKKAGTAESGEAGINPDSAAATGVKKYFSERWRHIDTTARDHWMKVQDMLEKAKKGAKYKLDKQGFGSTALDVKTNLRVEIAKAKAQGAASLMLLGYFKRLAKEFESYDDTLRTVFIFPFHLEAPEWSQIGILKEKYDSEKALARDSQSSAAVPGHADTILQLCLKIWTLLESARSSQLKQAMDKALADLHGAAQG